MTKVAKILLHQCILVAMTFIQAVIYYSIIPFKAGELLSPTLLHALPHISSSVTAQYPDTGSEL